MWWNKKNVCGYWDCKTAIPEDELLCAQHNEKWNAGFIDRCPKCQRFKDIMYYLCQDCYIGRKVKASKTSTLVYEPRQKYRIKYAEDWKDTSQITDRSYVYIVGYDDGSSQVGQTRDMSSRLAELREDQQSATGKNPRLDFMEVVAGEQVAEARIVDLNRMMESNPGQIQAMTYEFHQHMREFGFEVD